MTNSKRIYQIDLYRFLAALFVVLYHYCFRGIYRPNFIQTEYELLSGFSQYGYMGVDLFFIISGFVILMSASNSNIFRFLTSRISRLYPAYWFAVSLTALSIWLWDAKAMDVSWFQYLVNMTMLQGAFGVENIDGVYWTLYVELRFYFLIGVMLLFRKMKYVNYLMWFLIIVSILRLFISFEISPIWLKIIYATSFPIWSHYFVGGMILYLFYKKKYDYTHWILFAFAVALGAIYAARHAMHLDERMGVFFNPYITISLVLVFYSVMLATVFGKMQFLQSKSYITIGALTYPLYLLHQNLGYMLINALEAYPKYLVLALLVTGMLLFSYWVHKYVERWGSKKIKNFMNNKIQKIKFIPVKDKI
ncbi:MAG: acyltransferase [Flavobacteriaceae bacterium]|nr:acyltransferase [Flavobacteriaceae bacterium]